MRIRSGNILFIIVVLGLVVLESFGAGLYRPDVEEPAAGTEEISLEEQARLDSIALVVSDSLAKARRDSIHKAAIDTIRIPDSLEYKDTFKFKYFIALRDSLTRAQLRDSLRAAEDSLTLARFDSVFFEDSSQCAAWRYRQWYNSLSRKEKKREDYARMFPMLMHRQDSIMHRQDSIKAHKDSVIAASQRILETYAVPDTMLYKRIFTWTHDQYFNNIEIQPIDTSYNNYFTEYPFHREDVGGTYLGVIGSATQYYNYFKRKDEGNAIFYTPYRMYSYSPSDLLQYNTKTPFTELAYWGTLLSTRTKEEDDFKVMTTQNILPELNMRLEFRRWGGKGILLNEETANRTAVVAFNYMGKRYLSHFGYITNRVVRTENGGAVDQDESVGPGFNWIRDTTVDAREIAVRLGKANSSMRKHTVFLDQSYRIPFKFLQTEEEKAAGLEGRDMTSGFVGTSTELSIYTRKYHDEIDKFDDRARTLYQNFFMHPSVSTDSMRVLKLDNKVFIKLQPFGAEAVLSHLDIGVGDKLLNYYKLSDASFLGAKNNVNLNSVYAYAGVSGQYKQYFAWDAFGKVTFAGAEAGDFEIDGGLKGNIYPFRRYRKSPLTLSARVRTALLTPDWYQQHMYTNHFRWDEKFAKASDTRVNFTLDIPHWKLLADISYGLLANTVYYDATGNPRQSGAAVNLISASLMKNFKFGPVHLDNRVLVQYSSNHTVMPLPLLALNLRWYVQFWVVKQVMEMQIGANGTYTTKWLAPGYNPEVGVFYNQQSNYYGGCPYLDAFINIQWKKACIFLKVVNVNQGWPMKDRDYFSADHYIRPQRTFRLGIYWPFYIDRGYKKAQDKS
ncbi:MAG: putative porin [Bacteroidales bacterium]|nr:putative porin [Bacteroidales bacterium]